MGWESPADDAQVSLLSLTPDNSALPLEGIYLFSIHFLNDVNQIWDSVMDVDSPTMMCNTDVTASLVPTVAKQIQSVEPVGLERQKEKF